MEITEVIVIFQYRNTGEVIKADEHIEREKADLDQIKVMGTIFNDRGY